MSLDSVNQAVTDTPEVTEEDAGLTVAWPDGTRAWFHWFWLRENCACPSCRHPDAWERTVDLLALPLDIRPTAVTALADGLLLTWPDDGGARTVAPCEGSRYSWGFLDRHRSEPAARLERKRRPTPWRGSSFDLAAATVPWSDVMHDDTALLAALESLAAYGITIVDDGPNDHGAVVALAQRIAFVEGSHFGWDFDVESVPGPVNLAYTAHPLPPHNDLASREHMPGIQMLHCLADAAVGGESILVDGIAVADELRRVDQPAFDLLSTLPVGYHSVSDTWDIAHRALVIHVDSDGDVVGTRVHPALLGPVDVPPDRVGDFYRAYRALLQIATSDEMQLVFRMRPGQCQLFDNRRVLHARTAFDPNSGHRHLHGCYIPRDDVFSRLNVLRRSGADYRDR